MMPYFSVMRYFRVIRDKMNSIFKQKTKILLKPFDFVRVDLYPINDKIYFGELTHYPEEGFEKFTQNEYDVLLGSYI